MSCSPDLRGKLYLPERHCFPLFASSSSFARVSRLCLIDAFFRQPPSFATFVSFPFVHASPRMLHALSRSRRVLVSSRFRRYPPLSPFLYQLPLFYQRSPLSLCLCPASARTFSPFLFHPIHPRLVHFLDLSSSRFNPRTSVSASRTLSAIVFLFPSQIPECLSSTSLFTPCLLSPTTVLSLYLPPFPCPASFSLSLSSCPPPTHAHPPPSSSAGSVRIGPAR